jgi:hypothetical protein
MNAEAAMANQLPRRRRDRWLAGAALALAASACGAAPTSEPWLEAWVDLAEPAVDRVQGSTRQERVGVQQDRVAAQVRALGGVEIARVRHARNALAVRIDRDRLPELKRIPGVLRVRPTETLHPPGLTPKAAP